MRIDNDRLNDIYDRTDGRCHICRKQLAFTNYGVFGARGAWEIEHSRARVRGGSDLSSNLYAACISCNRSKGARSTKSARRAYGFTRAPLSRAGVERARSNNAVAGAALGITIGAALGPWGMALGAALGGVIGNDLDVD